MTILRSLAVVAVSLFALNSCGGKKEVASPVPAAPAEVAQPVTDSTDELFDEFFDSSSIDTAAAKDSTISKNTVAAKKDPVPSTDTAKVLKPVVAGKSAAVAKLEVAGKKVVTASTPAASAKAAPKVKANPDGRYVLQVSCVASEELASKIAKKLEKTGYPVYVAQVQNPTPQLIGTYYRIRIGGFSDRESAKAFGEAQLTSSGFTYWVDTRSNDNIGSAADQASSK